MLIVSRHIDESVQIGDDITVTILDIKGKQARIGISAPDNVTVHRDEIYEHVLRQEQGEDFMPRD